MTPDTRSTPALAEPGLADAAATWSRRIEVKGFPEGAEPNAWLRTHADLWIQAPPVGSRKRPTSWASACAWSRMEVAEAAVCSTSAAFR